MITTQTKFKFDITYQSKKSRARVGKIYTPHGVIDTPNFVAVGTNGSLKTLSNADINFLNLQLMFCNTYHLLLQPGTQIVKQAGGLHKFINRPHPIITDSGGFQVFSLAYGGVANELKSKGTKKQDGAVLKIDEEGVVFRSYRDGQKILLTPESSVLAQKDLGADIIIPLDELPPYHINNKKLKTSFLRTHRWQERSLNTHLMQPQNQAMYAVIHGGIDADLRKESCKILTDMEFNGFAIGGSLGKTIDELYNVVEITTKNLPFDAPNHLLGIGDLPSMEKCIPLGIDTFDSSYPTKAARHAILLTKNGNVKITKSIYKDDFEALDLRCPCPCCQNYSKAYLHHLFKAHEPTAPMLASMHNVSFMVQWMERIRTNILCGLI